MKTNRVRLDNEFQKEYKSMAEIDLIADHLDHKRPYHDSMDTHFGPAFLSYNIVLSTSVFEAIRSKGLK